MGAMGISAGILFMESISNFKGFCDSATFVQRLAMTGGQNAGDFGRQESSHLFVCKSSDWNVFFVGRSCLLK